MPGQLVLPMSEGLFCRHMNPTEFRNSSVRSQSTNSIYIKHPKKNIIDTYSGRQEDISSPVSVQVTQRVMIIVGKAGVGLGFSQGYAGTEGSSPLEFDLMGSREAVLIQDGRPSHERYT